MPLGREKSFRKSKATLDLEEVLAKANELKPHVKALVNSLHDLLDEHCCKDLIGFEVEETQSPYQYQIPSMMQETEAECSKNEVFTFIRKAKKQEEKLRFHLFDVAKRKEIGALNVSGVLVDYPLFNVVVEFFTAINSLKVLRLIDCSLKKESLMALGNILGKTKVTHLYLDRNPMPDQNYSYILKNNAVLKHLSLVQCHIDAIGTRHLGRELGPPKGSTPEHNLKSLNLNNNRIDCFAAKFIAQGLKWNRDLVYLLLAGNRIGNTGMEYISNALRNSKLEKWEKELKEERLLKRTEDGKQEIIIQIDEHMYDSDELCVSLEFEDLEESRSTCLYRTLFEEYLASDPNPLNADVKHENGTYVTDGNKHLRALNISYNKIEESGFEYLLNALRYQHKVRRRYMSTEERENYLLTNIQLMGNFCSQESKTLKKISYYLKKSKILESEPSWLEENEVEEAEEKGEEEDVEVEEETHITEFEVEKRGKKRLGTKERIEKEPEIKKTPDFDNLFTVPSDSQESSEIIEEDKVQLIKSVSSKVDEKESNMENITDSEEID